MQWDRDTAGSGKPRIAFVRCENKHEYICSSAATSLKNPLLVWYCDQRAEVSSLIKRR